MDLLEALASLNREAVIVWAIVVCFVLGGISAIASDTWNLFRITICLVLLWVVVQWVIPACLWGMSTGRIWGVVFLICIYGTMCLTAYVVSAWVGYCTGFVLKYSICWMTGKAARAVKSG